MFGQVSIFFSCLSHLLDISVLCINITVDDYNENGGKMGVPFAAWFQPEHDMAKQEAWHEHSMANVAK